MVINKKIKRTMLENKSQYMGSLLLIILSCLLFTMFNLLSSNISNISSSFEKNYNQEDANFTLNRKLNSINSLETKFNMNIEETRSVDYPVSSGNILRIFSQNTKINIPAIIEGKNLSGHDILIDPAYAKANKLKVNDHIKIYGKSFRVSGFMSLPNYIYPLKSESDLMNDPNSFGIGVIGKKYFNSFKSGNSFYSIKFNANKGSIDSRISQFKDYLRSKNIIILNWTNISENPRVTYVNAKLSSINRISSSMPVAILLLTCILTGTVMWRMLKRESIIIGTLYALGYNKAEIMKHYLIYPLSIALTGGLTGTALGILSSKPMINLMLDYFNMPMDSMDFTIKYIAISIILPVIFLGICSYFVIRNTLKYSPTQLMRDSYGRNKVSFIEKNLKLDKLKFSTKFKIREQLRNIPRSAFLLLGVILATMLLLFGFAAKSSIDYLMKDSFNQAFKYNYTYIFNSIQNGKPAAGEAFCEVPFNLKSNSKTNFTIYGINFNSKYISLKDSSGSKLDTDKVIITRPLADKLGLKPDDTIRVVNKLDSKEYSIKINGIAETYLGQYIYIPIEKLDHMLGYPPHSYMGLWSKNKLKIPEDKLLATATTDDIKKSFDAIIQPLKVTIGSISAISFIIGLIVIYVVTSLIIEENKKNIGLLRILGYRKKEIYSLILNSSSLTVIAGYILGIPLILAFLHSLFNSVTKDMSISFPMTINYIYIISGFIVIYMTYELSKALSKKKINRISMIDSLKSENE